MKRNTVNLVVDVLTFVGLMVVALTGLLMKFVLPSGSPRAGLTLFAWDRHDWGAFHFWATAGLGVILVLHLALHWRWVCTTVGRFVPGARRSHMPAWERNIVGAAWLAIIVGATIGLLGGAKLLVERDEGGGGGSGRHRGAHTAMPSSGEEELAMSAGGGRHGAGEGVQRRRGPSR